MPFCVIYARISRDTESSLSVETQIEDCAAYAEAHGLTVVGTFADRSVSATTHAPWRRPAFRALLDALDAEGATVVIIKRIDRLSRKTRQTLEVAEQLAERGVAVVSTDGTLDFSTTSGRFTATVLAAVAQQEAEMISDRIQRSRRQAITSGRIFGSAPYGWRVAPNPNGAGKVWEQDPERIEWVKGMVERAQAGLPIYSIVQWLDEAGAPLPTKRGRGGWTYSTVQRLLAHPVLAGMVLTNFGTKGENKARGDEVLRDDHGLPVVRPELAIMPLQEWREMLAAMDGRTGGAHTPRLSRQTTSPLLSGVMVCETDGARMRRGRFGDGRPGYSCPKCHQTLTSVEEPLVAEFLRLVGEHVRWKRVEVVLAGGQEAMPEIARRMAELAAVIDDDDTPDEQVEQAQREQRRLRARKKELRAIAPTVEYRMDPVGMFADDWAAAEGDVVAQRQILDDALEQIVVSRPAPGRAGSHADDAKIARLRFVWREWVQPGRWGEDGQWEPAMPQP